MMNNVRVSVTILLVLGVAVLSAESAAQVSGYLHAPAVKSWRLAASGGVNVLGSDLTRESKHYHFRPHGEIDAAHIIHRNIALGVFTGYGIATSSAGDLRSDTRFCTYGAFGELRILVGSGAVVPFLQARLGGSLFWPRLNDEQLGSTRYGAVTAGLQGGIEMISRRTLGARLYFGFMVTSSDMWDLIHRGGQNDGMSFGGVSVTWYFRRLFRY